MGMSLSWSDGRLLTGVGNNITYKYNQDGIRIEKNSSGWKTEYILNGTQIERERVYNTFGNLTYDKIYYYDANGIISSAIVYAADGDTYKAYYFSIRTNVQGDVLGVYNLDGNCLVSYTYDAWGNFTSSAMVGTLTSEEVVARSLPFHYRGYYYDEESDLYYLNSRYYDPYTGRFISADSLISNTNNLVGTNLFVYCYNNPVMCCDSNGKSAEALMYWTESMWWLCLIDGPIPVGEIVYGVGVATLAIAAVATISSEDTTFWVGPAISSLVENKAKVESDTRTEEKVKENTPIYIYRFGRNSPEKYVPSEKDIFYGDGLSFSINYRPGSGMTTIEELNATGVVFAKIDRNNHVSVIPIGGDLRRWHEQGIMSIWTMTIWSHITIVP